MLTDSTPGAVIHYTTDGSLPTTASPTYSGPLQVSKTHINQCDCGGARVCDERARQRHLQHRHAVADHQRALRQRSQHLRHRQ
jgi:hypothetical protein